LPRYFSHMSQTALNVEALVNRFDTAFTDLIGMLNSLDQDQLNEVPFEGSWTAAQVGEHILKSVFATPRLLRGASIPTTDREPDAKVAWMEDIFLNYDTKMKAPDFIIPEARTYVKSELTGPLESSRQQMIEAARSLDLTETSTGFELPNSGKFTRYEWISFVAIHTTRHNHQLKRIIAKLAEKRAEEQAEKVA
jgi:hypothetical protein